VIRRSVLALLAVVALQTQAAAQTELGGAAVAFRPVYRLRYAGSVREQSGTWFGGEVEGRAGIVSVRVLGLAGSLSGDEDSANPPRTVRTTSVLLLLGPPLGFQAGLRADARHIETPAATSLWRLAGPAARVTQGLGIDGLEARIEAAVFPIRDVSSGYRLNSAFHVAVGVGWVPGRSGTVIRLGYDLARYDFSPEGSELSRLEQLGGLSLTLGLRTRL